MASSSEVLAVDLEQNVFTNRDETVAGQLLVKGQPSSIKVCVLLLLTLLSFFFLIIFCR